jgi:hypothetical protein
VAALVSYAFCFFLPDVILTFFALVKQNIIKKSIDRSNEISSLAGPPAATSDNQNVHGFFFKTFGSNA